MSQREVQVAVIGAGLSGIGAAVCMRRAGIADFVLLERARELGGTWRDNTYPGCACDVPALLYSYTFAPNPGWSRLFAPQGEVLRYARDLVAYHQIADRIQYGADVHNAEWLEDRQRWLIQTASGSYSARVLVSATGPWSEPAMPSLPGLDGFEGTIFHTSRWDHSHSLSGATVALVGSGASAVQIAPMIQPVVKRLTIFQRTPHWILPKPDAPVSPRLRSLIGRHPKAQRIARDTLLGAAELLGIAMRRPRLLTPLQTVARAHLRRSVADAGLRKQLMPRFTIGCKQLILSNDWYHTLTLPNVDLVPHGVVALRPGSTIAADGVERSADTIILATGFTVTDLPIASRLRGRTGRTLAEVWNGSPRAYLGSTVHSFPNLFLLLGPNSSNGHASAVSVAELQLRYLIDALRAMTTQGITSVDVRHEVQRRFNTEVQARHANTVWSNGGCSSYFMDATGRISTMFPGSVFELNRRLARFDLSDYEIGSAPQPPRES